MIELTVTLSQLDEQVDANRVADQVQRAIEDAVAIWVPAGWGNHWDVTVDLEGHVGVKCSAPEQHSVHHREMS